MNTSWTAWARGLTDISLTAKLIAYELALLADTRGVSMVPFEHLEQVTSRSRRTIRTALKQLEDRGHLRGIEALPPPFSGLRFQLIQEPAPESLPPSGNSPPLSSATQEPGAPTADNEALRVTLRGAIASQWRGKPCWDLAATLDQEGPRRFGALISLRHSSGAASDPWDTLTLAWEVAQLHAAKLVAAREPWALWVHLVRRECGRRDSSEVPAAWVELDSLPTGTAAMAEGIPGRDSVGVDDFGPVLSRVVVTLVGVGLSEAIAWAGTARILELTAAGESRRHWLAGRDAKLQALGIGEGAARTWMTMLVGSRRGREGFLSSGDETLLRDRAREVVNAM